MSKQTIKTGIRIQMLNRDAEMAVIGRWTAASGPIKNHVAPNNSGWHIVRFADGGRLCVHEEAFHYRQPRGGRVMIAALYVESDGAYSGLPCVDPWDIGRDARQYAGPHPVVAHPPCQRWGRFWHGSTRKPHQFELGADEGCFAAALDAVRRWGGVLEHPQDSRAWKHHGIACPPRSGGWVQGDHIGWTCRVEQGFYGHLSRKPTWLYACGTELPELRWGSGEQRLHPVALERHGYEKARRIGMMAMVGGKDKTKIRNSTPHEFRDLLLSLVRHGT